MGNLIGNITPTIHLVTCVRNTGRVAALHLAKSLAVSIPPKACSVIYQYPFLSPAAASFPPQTTDPQEPNAAAPTAK